VIQIKYMMIQIDLHLGINESNYSSWVLNQSSQQLRIQILHYWFEKRY